jgi:protease stability complex PrcB-like protein
MTFTAISVPRYTGRMKCLRLPAVILVVLVALTSCLIVPQPPIAESPQATDDSGLSDPAEPGEEPGATQDAEPDRAPENASPAGVPDAEDAPDRVQPNAVQLPLRVVAAGIQSAVRTPAATTITTRMVLEEVWFAIHANQLTPPPVPEIDFSAEMVVLLILGERPSAGYSVRVSGATMGERAALITIQVRAPEPGRMTAAVVTSPFEISAIGITNVPVTFVGDDVRTGFDVE